MAHHTHTCTHACTPTPTPTEMNITSTQSALFTSLTRPGPYITTHNTLSSSHWPPNSSLGKLLRSTHWQPRGNHSRSLSQCRHMPHKRHSAQEAQRRWCVCPEGTRHHWSPRSLGGWCVPAPLSWCPRRIGIACLRKEKGRVAKLLSQEEGGKRYCLSGMRRERYNTYLSMKEQEEMYCLSRKGRREKQRFFCLWRNKRDTFFVFGGTRKVQLLCEWKRYATIFFFFSPEYNLSGKGRREGWNIVFIWGGGKVQLIWQGKKKQSSLSGKGKRKGCNTFCLRRKISEDYLAREKRCSICFCLRHCLSEKGWRKEWKKEQIDTNDI